MSGNSPPHPVPDPNAYYGDPVIPLAVVCIALTTLFVGLRLWSRGVILRALGLEDVFLVLAWLFGIGVLLAQIINIQYGGLGRQYAVFDSETLVRNLKKISFAITICYFFALVLVKISVLCLYVRVLTYPYVRLAAKIMLGVVGISHAWIIATMLTSCVPIEALWDLEKKKTAYCHSGDVWFSHSGINITTDFLISILPLTVLHKLHIPRRQKIALYLVFFLGFRYAALFQSAMSNLLTSPSVCIISLLRCLQFVRLGFIDVEHDTTPDLVIISIWTMLEVSIAIIVACIPTIKPVVSRFFPRFLASYPNRSDDDTEPWSGTLDQGRRRRYRQCGDDTIDMHLETIKASDHDSTEHGSRSGGRL
ncbi:hypothetical protein VTJ49DRAFT_4312 [Mycothermus thermophilus]|uniref:Rhodopsin domain-containing protein n=1 Tax=Humicola insolens TaxID=85995 RepID=A0ABR3V5Q1_HUMIN